MRKSISSFIVFMLLCGICFGQNHWQWLNPRPSGFACLKIIFTDHQTGFILNSNGDLIKTTDQGNNWNIINHFANATCLGIADSTAVIAGNAGAIHLSSDNGNSWSTVHSGINDQFQFVNVVSRDSFFVSTSAGIIYATGDKGKTWATLNCNTQLSSVAFVNSKIGFAGGTGSGILKTTDGGHSWKPSNQVNYSPSTIEAIQFLNQDTGYAFRQWDSVLLTYNGGITWNSYNAHETMFAIDFVNSKIGYLGGSDGALYRSIDGGINWSSISPSGLKYAYDISSLYFISADTGFAVGFLGRILKTTDSGQTWSSYSPTYTGIASVSFGSPSTGYAADRNYVYKTIDSGNTWNTLNLTTGTDYGSNSVFKYAHFTSADSGYIVSNEYVNVHKTNDGGQTWATINPAAYSYEDLLGVSYPDPQTGILSLGTLLVQTKNEGYTWDPLWTAQYSNQYFQKIFYVNATTAFALYYNQLYKTTDGFQSWSTVFTNPLGYSPTDIWFVNPQKGFIVDDEAEIFVTNDGGNNWEPVPLANSFLYSTGNGTIRFFNEQVGYMSTGNTFGPGAYGRIYKTTDGGKTWQKSYDVGGSTITFTPDSNVVIAGFGGTIVKSAIKGWQLDSFTVKTNNACGEILSASLGVALGEIDSIQFVLTKSDGTSVNINSSPGTVNNSHINFTSTVGNLIPDSTYSARVKFSYNNTYIYSDTLDFVSSGLPAPFIYDSSGVLISSYPSGNQWYLNGSAVAGATQQRFIPKSSGDYTVRITQDGCVSEMSNSLKYITNDLGLIIYPNPSRDYISFINTQNRPLQISIMDLTGKIIMTSSLNYYNAPINVKRLADGEYIINIRDQKSNQTANKLFIKL